MPRIRRLFFCPPLAIARVGPSPVPLEAFEWATDLDIHGAHRTVLKPTPTLEVLSDGSLRPYLPAAIRFKDAGLLRPVAPFFELWACVEDDQGETSEQPLNLALLRAVGASPASLDLEVTVANRKAQRRTMSAACAYIARVTAHGNQHEPQPLLAWSPHNPGETPLVPRERPIPLGSFQVLRPVPRVALGIDLSIIRVRFTPAKGEVYGPPTAISGPASPLPPGEALPGPTLGGRMHQIVPPANRILNEGTPWSSYVMDADDQQDPQPSDSYDGANVGDNVSWGVVDDTCDGVIGASLVVDGVRHTAVTRVFSSCPDFSPDRRPFYSLVDDLNDRDLPPVEVDAASLEAVEDEAGELFRRVLDTMSQMNVDATRAHGIDENSEHFALGKDFPKLPKIDQRSMTAEDKPYADKIPDLIPPGPPREDSPAVRAEELPYTEAARQIHGPLSDIETLLDFLRSRGDHVRMLLRPPFGRLRQLAEKPGPRPNPSFRDPRVERDTLQDMRMPPYMRDSDETPLSLSWRQYDMLLKLIDHLAKQPGEPPGPTARRVARHAARRVAGGGGDRP